MSSKEYLFHGAIIIALVSARSSPAHAEPESVQADVLFHQGKDLMAAGKIAEACAAFDASQKLDPTITTLLNQANCRERNGQLATAWGLFLEVERQTRSGTNKASQQMHTTAVNRATKLEPRLSTLRIDVPDGNRVDGLEIVRNGEILDLAAWNQVVPIDGGTYEVVARAPGKAAWANTVVIAAERDARVIEIPKLGPAEPASPQPVEPASLVRAPAPDSAAAIAVRTPAPPRAPAPLGAGSVWSTRRRVAVGIASGGVLALATGIVLGVSAQREQHDAQSLCPDRRSGCDDAERANELLLSGHHRAVGANVAFGVGAAATIATGVLWFTGAPESHQGVAVVPAASPGQVIVTASGSF